jgi:hypothetical protein
MTTIRVAEDKKTWLIPRIIRVFFLSVKYCFDFQWLEKKRIIVVRPLEGRPSTCPNLRYVWGRGIFLLVRDKAPTRVTFRRDTYRSTISIVLFSGQTDTHR